jgi:hypothetical protein
MHRIKECALPTEELKQNLLDEFCVNQSNNAGKTSAVVLQPAYRTLGLTSANSRRSATIGDNTRDIALGNIGANYSCILRIFLPSITQDGVKIPESNYLYMFARRSSQEFPQYR